MNIYIGLRTFTNVCKLSAMSYLSIQESTWKLFTTECSLQDDDCNIGQTIPSLSLCHLNLVYFFQFQPSTECSLQDDNCNIGQTIPSLSLQA